MLEQTKGIEWPFSIPLDNHQRLGCGQPHIQCLAIVGNEWYDESLLFRNREIRQLGRLQLSLILPWITKYEYFQ